MNNAEEVLRAAAVPVTVVKDSGEEERVLCVTPYRIAKVLGIETNTVRQACMKGTLPAFSRLVSNRVERAVPLHLAIEYVAERGGPKEDPPFEDEEGLLDDAVTSAGMVTGRGAFNDQASEEPSLEEYRQRAGRMGPPSEDTFDAEAVLQEWMSEQE